jgi:hypothetical protein
MTGEGGKLLQAQPEGVTVEGVYSRRFVKEASHVSCRAGTLAAAHAILNS